MKTAVALMTITLGGTCEAAACIDGHPSLEQEFARAKYVIKARVVGFKTLDKTVSTASIDDGVSIDAITFTIIHSYKEKAKSRSLSLLSPNDSTRIPVSLGEIYLAFVERRPESGDLFVDTCGNSDLWSAVPADERMRLAHMQRGHAK